MGFEFAAEHSPVVYKTFRGVDGHAAAIWTQRIEADDLDESLAVTAHLFQAEVVDKVADARVTVVGSPGLRVSHRVARSATRACC